MLMVDISNWEHSYANEEDQINFKSLNLLGQILGATDHHGNSEIVTYNINRSRTKSLYRPQKPYIEWF